MKKIIFLLLATVFFFKAQAQPQKVVADKIVAKVGDQIILHSDIQNAIEDYKRQGQEAELPPDPDCSFLQGQLIQKALVLQAQKDSLTISDDELDALLDNQIRGFIRYYGSQEMLEQIAGKTLFQLKEDLREDFRERKLADQERGKILDNIKITPSEVQSYFDQIPKDSLRFYESELEVSEIVIHPKANKEVEDYVSAELYEMKKQVESGQKKFDALARLYSDDPAVKDNGGQYSLNKNDKNWDPAFFAAAFKLKEGQISPVIKSKFGLHIIQMVSRAGDDAVIRHILKIPPVTDVEIKATIGRLDSVKAKINDGTITFSEGVSLYSDDDNSKLIGGYISSPDGSTYLTIDKMDKDLVAILKDLKTGVISDPQVYTDERGIKSVRLLYIKTRSQPHRENMQDDYNKISQRALENKKSEVLQQWFKVHIPQFYIYIDPSFKACSVLADWFQASAGNNL
ncbi:MAG: peptidylprolyl isomerase [Chitinophagaceae bacterium]